MTKKTLPDAVDERPRHPAIPRVREDGRNRRTPIGKCGRGWNTAQFGKQEGRLRVFVPGHVTAEQLQPRFRREEGGQRVGILQLPAAHEAVVTGIALEIHSQEDLRGVLGGLHPRLHGRTRFSPPVHARKETLRTSGRDRIKERCHEAVVGQVLAERREQPVRDALPASVLGKVGDAVFIPQQIVPERHPAFGVTVPVGQQRGHELRALVGSAVGDETFQRLARRQQSPRVEVDPPREHGVGHELRLRYAAAVEVRRHKTIGRTRPCRPDRLRQRWRDEAERSLPGRGRRRSGRVRTGSLVDPEAKPRDLLVAQRQVVERHLRLDFGGDAVEQQAARAVAGPYGGAAAAPFEDILVGGQRQTSLSLVRAVALQAVGLENGLHGRRKID